MSMTDGFSARNIPFYGLPNSKRISEAPTVDEAINLAGLDWNVNLEPMYQFTENAPEGDYTTQEGSFNTIPDRFLTVRSDTNAVLGAVGKQYTTFQNSEAFSFVDELLGFGVEFDAAGCYDNSRKVFLTAKLPNGITVPGTDDSLDLYCLFKTSHDGSSAITTLITPIRISCTNMMNLATKSLVSKWSTRHTRSAADRVQEAARTLNLVDSYRTEFEATSTRLLETEVNLDGFTTLINELTPSSRHHEGMLSNWRNSPTVDRSTAWGAVNAIGEYAEYFRGGRGDTESRFESNIDGQTAALRNRAVNLLIRR